MIAIFPQLAACATSKDTEKLAVLVRTQFGFTSPTIDASELLKSIGIESEALDLDCSGNLLVRDEKGQFSVIALVPSGLTKDVRQFRLAHLLGHFLLHVQSGIAGGTYKDHGFRELTCPYARYLSGTSAAGIKATSSEEAAAEDLADEFAAAVLLPKSLMEAAAAKGAKVAEMADFFGCSPDLVACRLARLGLVKQDVGAGKKSSQAKSNANAGGGMARLREIASRLEGSAGTPSRK
jgi:hypothetical protein